MTLDLEAIKRDLQPIERDDPTFSPHSDAHLWIGHTADLVAELERARAVLSDLEWAQDPELGRFCKVCRGGHPEDWRKGDPGPKGPGHVPGCELAALLSAAPAPARSAPQ